MNPSVKNIELQHKIFTANNENFNSLAFEVFQFQYKKNELYRKYCDTLKVDPNKITGIEQIPFLPIQFFKSHRVSSTLFEAEAVFESSGTMQTGNSKHFVKNAALYQKSFNEAFRLFYGDPAEWCIIGLLPSYLERNNSSLVMMADSLVQQSRHAQSGFYLNEWQQLNNTLQSLEKQQQKTLLIGVTFALLDFAEIYSMPLRYTSIMETGGMKGRRKELTREEVHKILRNNFQIENIHSEYGMTELLSQAYSSGSGIFSCPPWMKVLLREEDDPFALHTANASGMISGAINVIDLANIYSCSFIATEDAGKLYPDHRFEILGRLDNSDIRGCSLLAL